MRKHLARDFDLIYVLDLGEIFAKDSPGMGMFSA